LGATHERLRHGSCVVACYQDSFHADAWTSTPMRGCCEVGRCQSHAFVWVLCELADPPHICV
ncbi:hypothetical protein PIB30_112500, partial [Stylosanthes scabra]|nr:hypothetical protein [Stylosanthes scabra]